MPSNKGTNKYKVEAGVDYRISNFRMGLRYLMLGILLVLNYSLIMSTFELHKLKPRFDITTDVLSLLLVLFFDITILFPTIFQVVSLSITPEGIGLSTLMWKSTLKWTDIVWFGKPATLNFAVIRSRKSVYLISKGDFINLEDIVQIIMLRWKNQNSLKRV